MRLSKDLTQYELIISDLDGTLYIQRPVQLVMGVRMLLHAIASRTGRRELRAVLTFRKVHERAGEVCGTDDKEAAGGGPADEGPGDGKGDVGCKPADEAISGGARAGLEHALFIAVAECCGEDEHFIEASVRKWLYEKPLGVVALFRDRRLCGALRTLSEKRRTVVILSDHPTEGKCRALGLSGFPQYYGGCREIGALKPDPKGIRHIMRQYGADDPKKVLMIGDRESKDGEAARRAGVSFLLVKRYGFLSRYLLL